MNLISFIISASPFSFWQAQCEFICLSEMMLTSQTKRPQRLKTAAFDSNLHKTEVFIIANAHYSNMKYKWVEGLLWLYWINFPFCAFISTWNTAKINSHDVIIFFSLVQFNILFSARKYRLRQNLENNSYNADKFYLSGALFYFRNRPGQCCAVIVSIMPKLIKLILT